MNISSAGITRLLYRVREYQKPLLTSATFLVLLVFAYLIILRPQIVAWQLSNVELAKAIKTFERYRDFEKIVSKIDQQRGDLSGADIQNAVSVPPADRIEQAFFETMNTICDQTKVRIERTAPTVLSDSRKSWALSFVGDFTQTCQFLSLVERSYRIESLALTSGLQTARHTVDVHVAELIPQALIDKVHNDVIEKFTGKDMFVLYDEVARLIADIRTQSAKAAQFKPPARDVFLYADTFYYVPADQAPQEKVRAVDESPKIRIDGIFWDPDVPVAVIEGKALRQGDTIKGARIIEIQEKAVVVKYKEKKYTLSK